MYATHNAYVILSIAKLLISINNFLEGTEGILSMNFVLN